MGGWRGGRHGSDHTSQQRDNTKWENSSSQVQPTDVGKNGVRKRVRNFCADRNNWCSVGVQGCFTYFEPSPLHCTHWVYTSKKVRWYIKSTQIHFSMLCATIVKRILERLHEFQKSLCDGTHYEEYDRGILRSTTFHFTMLHLWQCTWLPPTYSRLAWNVCDFDLSQTQWYEHTMSPVFTSLRIHTQHRDALARSWANSIKSITAI